MDTTPEHRQIEVHCRALLISSLIVISTIVHPLLAFATPSQVTVNLFESRPPFSEIEIESPVEIVRPIRRQISGKSTTLVLRSKGAEVIVLAVESCKGTHDTGRRTFGNERPITRAPVICLRGLNPRGTSIRLAPDTVRNYRGTIIVSSKGNAIKGDKLAIRNQVNINDYVVSVVGSETQPNWPKEAIKAQAVLTQTRLARLKPGDVFGDSTQTEAYLGSRYERPGIRDIVQSVWGKTLQFEGRPITCFYHSCCAGSTSSGVDIFGDAAKSMVYLKAVKCDHCKSSNFWKTTKTRVPFDRFKKVFGQELPEIMGRDTAERPSRVKLSRDGVNQSELSGYQFWIELGQAFGWDKAPGTRFNIQRIANTVAIESTGAGHGVGLCQWGAAGLANTGKTYEQILKFYFPGTSVFP